MKRVSDRFLQLAVLFGLIGMGLGVMMGKTQDFTLHAVHAHINLLGWVSMSLYGLVYRAVPKAAAGILPVIHFWLAVASYLVMMPALAMFYLGHKEMEMVLAVTSMTMWASMLLFAIIVWRSTWKAE
jgi:hypothetical protein